MTELRKSIEDVVLANHDSIGFPTNHIHALELYRETVVTPSLHALSKKIDELDASNDPAAVFAREDYADLHQQSVAGFLLTTQSSFERALRRMLSEFARHSGNTTLVPQVRKASWSETQKHNLHQLFQHFVGIHLQGFETYDDLNILQTLGSALRHGDGAAAERLHELCPGFWINWVSPGTTLKLGDAIEITFPDTLPKHPSMDSITLPEEFLKQMIQSVVWFWEDLEFIRCNSFKSKGPGVMRMLEDYRRARPNRLSLRVWNPIR